MVLCKTFLMALQFQKNFIFKILNYSSRKVGNFIERIDTYPPFGFQ